MAIVVTRGASFQENPEVPKFVWTILGRKLRNLPFDSRANLVLLTLKRLMQFVISVSGFALNSNLTYCKG